MRLLIPAYIYPSDNPASRESKDWESIFSNASKIYGVIINVASGPGPSTRDTNYVRLVSRLKTTNLKVFGYISSDYARTFPVQQCIDHVKQWESLWGITDIFIDEAAQDASKLPFYTALHAAIKGVSVLNHGVLPDRGYLNCGSILCTAETSWANLRDNQFPGWATESENPGRFYHIAMAVPGGEISSALKFMSDKAEFVYVSDHSEPKVFTTLPTYWNRLLGQLQMYPPTETTISETVPAPTENTAVSLLIQVAVALQAPADSTLGDVPGLAQQRMSELGQFRENAAAVLRTATNEEILEELGKRLP